MQLSQQTEVRVDGLTRGDFGNRSVNEYSQGRFVITAATAGALVDMNFLSSLEGYCKAVKAKLRILPMRAHVRALEGQLQWYDTAIEDYVEKGAVFEEIILNQNLKAVDLQINPQQVDPLTGITRLGRSSLIVAHTKLAMTHVPSSNSKLPRIIATTGVCTRPNYHVNRAGVLATQDHQLAAIVVEIDGDDFHLRHLEADVDGSIVDLGIRYFPNGRTAKERAEFITFGDIHAEQADPSAVRAWAEICALLEPKRASLHDLLNGGTISGHDEGNMIERTRNMARTPSLEAECEKTRAILNIFVAMLPTDCEIYNIPSNHNDWLHRYLTAGRFAKDPVNYWYAIKLLNHIREGRDPLKEELDPKNRVTFLGRNDDLWVDGIQHNCHGDIGPNGAKGSPDGLEKAYGKVTHGHVHSPYRRRGVIAAGTTSVLRQGFNNGPSSWLHNVVVQYKGGLRQSITSLNGRWRSTSKGFKKANEVN